MKIFPDVDNRYKFGFLNIVKGVPTPKDHTFDARFYLHDPARSTGPPIRYSVEMMRRFSPENLSLMEFRSERDYESARRYARNILCSATSATNSAANSISLKTAISSTSGARTLKAGNLPLYEGKMIFQFDSDFAPGTYYVVEKEVREELLRKELFGLGSSFGNPVATFSKASHCRVQGGP